MFNQISFEIGSGTAKNGNPYKSLVIKIDDMQVDRVFIKDTEVPYYSNLEGTYQLEAISKK